MTGLRYAHVMAQLLEEVRAGQLRAGSRVPGEVELARRFSVSRVTTRRALDLLAQAGIVERARGRGTFVRSALPDLERARAELGLPASSGGVTLATIGLLLPDFADAYGLELVRGVEEECTARGHHLLLRRSYGERQAEEAGVAALRRAGAGALIVFPVHGEHYNPALLQAVLDGYPLVLVDRYLRGIPAPSVVTDNVAAAQELTAHLLSLGHRDVAFVSPPIEHTTSLEDRFAGYGAALAAAGLGLRQELVLHALQSTLPLHLEPGNVQDDVLRLREFIARAPGVTAFVVAEYNLALTVTHVLRGLGLQVPQDVSVSCFDAAGSPLGGPDFTHIRQGENAIGRRAVALALARLDGQPTPQREYVPYALVPGASTAPPPAARPPAPSAPTPGGSPP
ncbi:substrate-binding domain-containing protein [Deinococcus koreensis]|uniref:GntR family transcriptional regulator n=1 Tax=Deinococcus koreensis TaxID=2054903 RepID=A0A2K3UYP4_9DEIO|nr:GntR family transcriptional regulator [Deinococcus koreensis]PNY81666.1 GntR family transcriptional regulator [Deinococcus koreensis]